MLAGLPGSIAESLRSAQVQVDTAATASLAIELLQRTPAARVIGVSEMLPGAGDVLTTVEGDARLSRSALVLVGESTALAAALQAGGGHVVSRRKAGERLLELVRDPELPADRARRQLLESTRRQINHSLRRLDRSHWLVDESRRMCQQVRGISRRTRLQKD